jgi:hypothetical protein
MTRVPTSTPTPRALALFRAWAWARAVAAVQPLRSAWGRVVLALALSLASLGSAQAAYYTATASAATATAYPWLDISSTGTSLPLADDSISATLNIGFTFNFGGTNYTGLRVMSNGMVQFGGTDVAYFNATLPLDGAGGKPNIDAALMPLWDDFDPGNGQVRYKMQGTAPNRVFIVSWNAVPYFNGGSDWGCVSWFGSVCTWYGWVPRTATFQVQIHEQGQFVYRYGSTDGSGGTHSSGGSFTNPSGATIGVEVGNSDYVQYARNSAAVPSGTTIVWTRSVNKVAEYLFNENSWAGTANEVLDTSGSGYHGTAASLSSTEPTTVLVTPATGTASSGTCGYGTFNRSNKDHVALPSAFPNLGTSSSFTVTAWIRTTDNTLPNQRIFIDDANNNGGFGLTLGDPGTGSLRLLSRNISNGSMDTPLNVIASNTWYFVAFSFDLSAKTKTIWVYNTAGTLVNTTSATFTNAALVADSGITTIGGEANGNSESTSNYGFSGNIDEVRVYSGVLSTTDLAGVRTLTSTCATRTATLQAYYPFEEDGWTGVAGELADNANNYDGAAQGSQMPSATTASPARAGNTGTCGYATLGGPIDNGAGFTIPNLPVLNHNEAQTSMSFWMYWDGTDNVIAASFGAYDLWFNGGSFGFNTNASDIYGRASAGLANGWHHVAVVFTVGNVTANKMWIDGVAQTLSQRLNTPYVPNAVLSLPLRLGGYGPSTYFRFMGRVDELRVYSGAISDADVSTAYTATHLCPITLPGRFNAFETSTLTGAVTGKLKTKIAGTPFNVSLVSLSVLNSVASLLPSFVGLVKIEMLDASDNSGALNDTSGCRSSWTALPAATSTTSTFSLANLGRITASLTHANAARNVRLRVSFPATGVATAVGCSTDNFAIRPASLGALAITDGDWQTAGTSRNLLTTALSGGAVHKAGQPFTVKASALGATSAVTAGYDGVPTALLTACSSPACGAVLGTLTLNGSTSNGLFSSGTASYSEVGAFGLQLVDSTFAAIDAFDGSTSTERNIVSSVLTVGRFVPDHFELGTLTDPVLQTFGNGTCSSRAFTYVGQPFGYATVPQAQVRAVNAAGTTLQNYAGSLWKLTAGSLTSTWSPLAPAAGALTAVVSAPTLSSNGNGTGLITASASDKLSVTRSTSAPVAPFNAAIGLSWSVLDATEAAVTGNGTIGTLSPLLYGPIAFDAGALFRSGRLRVMPAVGTELAKLPVPIAAEFWDGNRWLTHTSDSCTELPAAAIAQGNYLRNLGSCETAPGSGALTLNQGRAFITLAKPGVGNAGSVDLTLQLGDTASGQRCSAVGAAATSAVSAGLSWLQGKWQNASTLTANPVARISFGQVRSPVVYMREIY